MYTAKEAQELASMHQHKPVQYFCDWILMVLNKGAWGRIQDWLKKSDLEALSQTWDLKGWLIAEVTPRDKQKTIVHTE